MGYFVYTYYKKYYGNISNNTITINNVDDFYYKNYLALKTLKKPKIWIHIPFHKNSRHWESFGSRSNENLNLPFVYMCLKSIIDSCGHNFDVIIYDDSNIVDILQEESEFDEIEKLSGVLLEKFRDISKAKILHKYGGIHLPCTLILTKCISSVINKNEFTASRVVNDRINTSNLDYVITTDVLACKRNCEKMKEYIQHLKEMDYSLTKFNFESNTFLEEHAKIIPEEILGGKDNKNEIMTMERLFSEDDIDLTSNHVGLYVNLDELLIRSKYQWFLRMSMNQIYASKDKFFLARYLYSIM